MYMVCTVKLVKLVIFQCVVKMVLVIIYASDHCTETCILEDPSFIYNNVILPVLCKELIF